MADHQWQFRLSGDEFDVLGLAELFASEAKITRGADGTCLDMSLPYGPDQAQAAWSAAEDLLAKLNAIARIIYGNHENVGLAAIGLTDPNGGPLQQFMLGVGGIRSRARVSAVGVVTGGSEGSPTPTKLLGDKFLEAADKNEHIDRALYLFGSLPSDWRGLYMVLEAAADANGGKSGLIAKNWVPQGRIESFKATANSYKAIRRAARHGSIRQGIVSATITLSDAYQMIRTILKNWADEIA
jgi:hypothetical protein